MLGEAVETENAGGTDPPSPIVSVSQIFTLSETAVNKYSGRNHL